MSIIPLIDFIFRHHHDVLMSFLNGKDIKRSLVKIVSNGISSANLNSFGMSLDLITFGVLGTVLPFVYQCVNKDCSLPQLKLTSQNIKLTSKNNKLGHVEVTLVGHADKLAISSLN